MKNHEFFIRRKTRWRYARYWWPLPEGPEHVWRFGPLEVMSVCLGKDKFDCRWKHRIDARAETWAYLAVLGLLVVSALVSWAYTGPMLLFITSLLVQIPTWMIWLCPKRPPERKPPLGKTREMEDDEL